MPDDPVISKDHSIRLQDAAREKRDQAFNEAALKWSIAAAVKRSSLAPQPSSRVPLPWRGGKHSNPPRLPR